jgi:hypothetical protein
VDRVVGVARRLPVTRDVDPGLLREVLVRHGWRCCVCGRPCGRRDVWRHSEPGLVGERPENFSAMCEACRLMAMGKGAAPARYVVRLREPGLAWRRAQVWIAEGLTVTVGVAYAAFAVFLVWAVERVPVTQWGLVADALIFFAMVLLLAVVVRGLLDRWRWRASARAMERGLDKEARRCG